MINSKERKLLPIVAACTGMLALPAFAAGSAGDIDFASDGESGGNTGGGVVLAMTPVVEPSNDADWVHLANQNIRTAPGAGLAQVPSWLLGPGNGDAEARHSDQGPDGRKNPDPLPPVVGHSDQWGPKGTGGEVPPIDWLPGGRDPDIRVREVPAPGSGVLLLIAAGAASRRRRR